MYDPKIVAHEVRILGYSLITVWHVDPETDGTDDSCGYTRPKLTDKENKIINDVIRWEEEFPFFMSESIPFFCIIENPTTPYIQQTAAECLAYVAAAWFHIAWERDRRHRLDCNEWQEIMLLAVNPHDNLRAILADPDEQPEEKVHRFLWCVFREYLRYRRPWWKHPKWHIRHWKLQIHPIQSLKRWLFSRCAKCGKGFSWGYAPVSNWGEGQRWFEGEKNVYHHKCYKERPNVKSEA